MRIALLALALGAASAVKPPKKSQGKPKRPHKLVGPNAVTAADSNTCYVTCDDVAQEDGCEVFDMAQGSTTLGSFTCEKEKCAPGEDGEGTLTCDLSGINDLNADDTSASCGGDGLDFYYIIGRTEGECSMSGSEVTCQGTCVCNSCDCDPCEAQGKVCHPHNGPNGGYQCRGN